MKKKLLRSPLLWGVIASGLIILLAMIVQDYKLAQKVTGIIGGLCLLVAIIFSGALNNGDRTRGNNSTDSREDREERARVIGHLLKFSLPNLICFALFYFLNN